MFDTIEADYDRLEQVSSRFMNQTNTVQQTLSHIQGSMGNLQGNWIGRGSEAFFAEMQGVVLPAVTQLQQALEEGARVTNMVTQIIQQAEEEASSCFRV